MEIINGEHLSYVRTCPSCGRSVSHTTKAKCGFAERHGRPCSTCSRKANGKANAGVDSCPICGTVLRITNSNPVEAIAHAAGHSLSLEELWLVKMGLGERPRCRCGCGGVPHWVNWKTGYSEFIVGHNGNVNSSYAPEDARKILEKRSASLTGRRGWSLGLTADTDERVRRLAISIKESLKHANVVPWNRGLTKETDERVAKCAENAKGEFADGTRVAWMKGLSEETDERLRTKNDAARARYESGELVPWHKGKTASDDPRIAKIWEHRDPVKEYAGIRWSDDEIRELLAANKNITLTEIKDYRNDKAPALVVKCTSCGWSDTVTLGFARGDRCPACKPNGSRAQHEIADWIVSQLKLDVGRNVRGIIAGRRELDIYVPMSNVAIEFNGLYWHGEKVKLSPAYHQQKTDACQAINIKLFHVFEDEWRDKRSIIESMIAFRLNCTHDRVPARECTVARLTPKVRREFFSANHLDGDVPCEASWGLWHGEDLVYALSVRKPRHRKYTGRLEIARCSPRKNVVVQGGVSKLNSVAADYARDNGYTHLLTYVDERLGGEGSAYQFAGFQLVGRTPPRFWWTDGHQRFNRFRFRADKPAGLTEAAVAEACGVFKIWGCRNRIYEMKL